MKNLLTILIATALTVSAFGQVDTSKYIITPFKPAYNYPNFPFKNCNPIELTTNDIDTIEILLKQFIADYNVEQEKQIEKFKAEHPESKVIKSDFIIDLTKYGRQYTPVINDKSQKEIWIYCFCLSFTIKNWREHLDIPSAKGGGNCFFNLKVNLTTKKYYDLIVNANK